MGGSKHRTKVESPPIYHPKRILGPLIAMSAAATEVTGRDRAKFFRRPLLKKGMPLRYIRSGTYRIDTLEDWKDLLSEHHYKFLLQLEKVMGSTGFEIILVFIASFSPAQGERNQMVNAKFTRPVNAMPMSSEHSDARKK